MSLVNISSVSGWGNDGATLGRPEVRLAERRFLAGRRDAAGDDGGSCLLMTIALCEDARPRRGARRRTSDLGPLHRKASGHEIASPDLCGRTESARR